MSDSSLDDRPDVTVILVSYNTCHLVEPLFDALEAATGDLSVQTIVVDNASKDGSLAMIRRRAPGAIVIANRCNVGFGRANNQALARARGRYLLLLNTDAFVQPDTLSRTIALMDRNPDYGVVGVKLLGSDGSVQPSCRFFPTPWNIFLVETGLARLFPGTQLVDDPAGNPPALQECDWVPGCYYLVRREVVAAIGLFDPRFFLYYEEVDHCRTLKARGWKVVYDPGTSVIHVGGESAQALGELRRATRQVSALQIESELLYMRKHHGLAGVVTLSLLMSVARVINAAKSLLRGSGLPTALAELRANAGRWSLLTRTQFGLKPTR